MKFRKPILQQFKKVWLDEEGYRQLRVLKKILKKSMAQIIKDLIQKCFSDNQ